MNATDFQEVKFFKNELDNNNGDKGYFAFDILAAYKEFYNNHVYYDGYSLSNIYAYFTEVPFADRATSSVKGGSGILEYLGGPVAYEEKQASKIAGKVIAESIETQSHHIIPRAIYKKYAAKLAPYLKLNAEFNLKNLPVPFHGNHPQYNKFVGNQIEKLIQSGNLNAATLRGLQEDLTKLINKAYDSGEKLNDYFRGFN